MRRFTKGTRLVSVRELTDEEKKEHRAEVVFERRSPNGRRHVIYAICAMGGWSQWGEENSILGDNVDAIERWAEDGLEAFDREA